MRYIHSHLMGLLRNGLRLEKTSTSRICYATGKHTENDRNHLKTRIGGQRGPLAATRPKNQHQCDSSTVNHCRQNLREAAE